MKCGHLHRAVGQHRSGRADDLLDLVGRKPALLVEGGRLHRKVDGLDAHVAFGPGVGAEGDVGRDLRRLAIVGGDGERIEGGIFAGGLVAGRKRHLDLHERHVADDVVVADVRHGRHLHAPPVLGAGDLARRRKPRGLGVLAGLAVVGGRRQLHDLGRRGELLAAVERGQQRHAHQDGRGHAGQERAGKPARRNLPLVGRSAAAVGKQRRLVAEFGYGFPQFRPFRKATSSPTRSGLLMICCRDNCLPRGAKSTKARSRSPGFALSIPPPYHARVARPLQEGVDFRPAMGPAIGLHCGAAEEVLNH